MTHMAAVLLYVFTAAAAPSEIAGAEADAFWCFAALLAEIKTRGAAEMDGAYSNLIDGLEHLDDFSHHIGNNHPN